MVATCRIGGVINLLDPPFTNRVQLGKKSLAARPSVQQLTLAKKQTTKTKTGGQGSVNMAEGNQ